MARSVASITKIIARDAASGLNLYRLNTGRIIITSADKKPGEKISRYTILKNDDNTRWRPRGSDRYIIIRSGDAYTVLSIRNTEDGRIVERSDFSTKGNLTSQKVLTPSEVYQLEKELGRELDNKDTIGNLPEDTTSKPQTPFFPQESESKGSATPNSGNSQTLDNPASSPPVHNSDDRVQPVFLTAELEDNGQLVKITYDEPISKKLKEGKNFSIKADDREIPVADVTVDGNIVMLRLVVPVLADELVSLSYNHDKEGDSATVQDDSSNKAKSLISVQIDNNISPSPLTLHLARSSATILNENATTSSRVGLVGQAGKSAILRVVRNTENDSALMGQAGRDGKYTISGFYLDEGKNEVSVQEIDERGNVKRESTLNIIREVDPGVGAKPIDPVLYWNQVALDTVRDDAASPVFATRALAMQSIAVQDTIAAIDNTPAYLVGLKAGTSNSDITAAVSSASYEVLRYLFPAQSDKLLVKFNEILGLVNSDAEQSIDLGHAVASGVIAIRERDGWKDFLVAPSSEVPGKWRATAPMFNEADSPQWAAIQPFSLEKPSQLRPSPPPLLSSEEYTSAFIEVKTLGSADSSNRTLDQTRIARFWADGLGSYTPPGHWNQIAQGVAHEQGVGLGEAARIFAILNAALADASIAAWDTKYAYTSWRPITAIRNAESDGNDNTDEDLKWQPLLITPNHPEYVSGHSTYSSAAAKVLDELLPLAQGSSFSTSSLTLLDGQKPVSKTYESIDIKSAYRIAAEEAGLSRIYGGLHFGFSNRIGQQLGLEIAQQVLNAFRTDQDLLAPRTVLQQENSQVFNGFPTITGFAFDNISGIKSVSISLYTIKENGTADLLNPYINDYAINPYTIIDSRGRLEINGASLENALDTDFLKDGQYELALVASDYAGNISNSTRFNFYIDRTSPFIRIDSIRDNDNISEKTILRGAVDGTGSKITELKYQWVSEGSRSPERFINFDSLDGSFNELLDVSQISTGLHTLVLTTTDSAGLSASTELSVELEKLTPFRISSYKPTWDEKDVSPMFRPEILFSRPVDPSSLNKDSFWIEDIDKVKIDASIVTSSDGLRAWLFLEKPFPSNSYISMNIDGNRIQSKGDRALLDADSNGVGGGLLTTVFSTTSLNIVPNTTIVGRVVGPGLDLKPMSIDDFRAGRDGAAHTDDDVFLNPIKGATVYILGLTSEKVLTDENGFFELSSVPAGVVKLAIDGRTAELPPEGMFYPEMVMDLAIEPGVVNTVMGSMGSSDEQLENESRSEVYLPLIPISSLQQVNTDRDTLVVAIPDATANITQAQRDLISLVVKQGSVVGENGDTLENPRVGIATVPPELVRDMLPPGLLQHTFDITIQAPGAAVFSSPLQLTLPNVFNAAPGTKLSLLSFDHTTGRLVIDGTATVSQDGLSAVTDPDSGVVRPGWHGLTPPISETSLPQRPDIYPVKLEIPGNSPPIKWKPVPQTKPTTPAQEPEIPKEPEEDPCKDAPNANTKLLNDKAFVSARVSEIAACIKLLPASKIVKTGIEAFALIADLAKAYYSFEKAKNDLKQSFKDKQALGIIANDMAALSALKDGLLAVANSVTEFIKSNPVIDAVTCAKGLLSSAKDVCQNLNTDPCTGESQGLDDVCKGLAVGEAFVTSTELILQKWNAKIDKIGVAVALAAYEALRTEIQKNADAAAAQQLTPTLRLMSFRLAADTVSSSTLDDERYLSSDEYSQLEALLQAMDDEFSAFMSSFTEEAEGFATDLTTGSLYYDSENNKTYNPEEISESLIRNAIELLAEDGRVASGGYFYLAKVDGVSLRGHANGKDSSLFLGANADLELFAYDSLNNSLAIYRGATNQAGTSTVLPELVFSSVADIVSRFGNNEEGYHGLDLKDADNDGLIGILEEILGTSKSRADSDGDGITDSRELTLNTDPTGGKQLPIGILSTLELPEIISAKLINIDASSQTVAIALDDQFVSFIDLDNPLQPKILSKFAHGVSATALSVDPDLNLVMVASGEGERKSVKLIDYSEITRPSLFREIAGISGPLAADAGRLYAGNNERLTVYDVLTDSISATIDLDSNISALTVKNNLVYALQSNATLTKLEYTQRLSLDSDSKPIIAKSLIERSNLRDPELPVGVDIREMVLDNGLLYIPVGDLGDQNRFRGGIATVDVSGNTPRLLATPNRSVVGSSVSLTGSGLLLSSGSMADPSGTRLARVDLLNVSDPSQLLRSLPVESTNVIHQSNGLTYLFGEKGLVIANLLSYQIEENEPTLRIKQDQISGLDLEPSTPEIDVVEGSTFELSFSAQDDTALSNIQLFQNNELAATDSLFPYEFKVRLPSITENGGSKIELELVATDFSGNKGTSGSLLINLLPDTDRPNLLFSTVRDGDIIDDSVVEFYFSKPVTSNGDLGSVFRLYDANNSYYAPTFSAQRDNGQSISLGYGALDPGRYNLKIDYTRLVDSIGQSVTSSGPLLDSSIELRVRSNPNLYLDDITKGVGGFIISGPQSASYFAQSLSPAGDINNDGFDDILISAPLFDGQDWDFNAGAAYIITGSESPSAIDLYNSSNLENVYQITGASQLDLLGSSVSALGDFNGDGFDDIAIASPSYFSPGKSYIVFGRQVLKNLAVGDLSGSEYGITLTPEGGFDPRTVTALGDINLDGLDDIAIGANSSDAYRAYIIYGRRGTANIALSDVTNGKNGHSITINNADHPIDFTIAGVGDVNGDRFTDIAISMPSGGGLASGANNEPISNAGRSYIIYGGHPFASSSINLDSASLPLSQGFIIYGYQERGAVDLKISAGGDINHDGFADLLIGAPNESAVTSSELTASGNAYVIFGGDNLDNLVLSDLAISPQQRRGFVVPGHYNNQKLGGDISYAGDLNGDGLDDLLIGRDRSGFFEPSGGNSDAGYIIFGKMDANSVDLASLENTLQGMVINEDNLLEMPIGNSVSSAGDFNGDGFDDFIIGEPFDYGSQEASKFGKAYIIYGSNRIASNSIGNPAHILGTDSDDYHEATSNKEHILPREGSDTVVGAGAYDVINLGNGNDYFIADNSILDPFVGDINGGHGIDTFAISDAGNQLYLPGLVNPVQHPTSGAFLQSFEIIDISGNGDNQLLIDSQSIHALSSTDWLTSYKLPTPPVDNSSPATSASPMFSELVVRGNTGDSVRILDDGWIYSSPSPLVGDLSDTYNILTNDSTSSQLYIQQQVGVQFLSTET